MVTTFAGENRAARQAGLAEITAKFLTEYGEMGLEKLDGDEADFSQMIAAVQSLPFLAAKKLIILRSPGANKDFVEKFEQFLSAVAETNDVIIVESKLDKRLSYYKLLKKLTDFHEFRNLDDYELARQLVDYSRQRGGKLTSSAAQCLIERVGVNQLNLQNEIDKLILYEPEITKDSIELLTEKTPQSQIFDLLDAAFAGRTKRAMELYQEQRKLKVEPQQIIAMLVWQLHILAIVITAGQKSEPEIAKEAKLSPFTVSKTRNLAKRISLADLKRYIIDLREIDIRLKREALDPDGAVQNYLLSLS